MFVDQKGVLRSSLLIPINRRASCLMGFRFIGFDLFFIFVIIIIILLKNLRFFFFFEGLALGILRPFYHRRRLPKRFDFIKKNYSGEIKKKKLLLNEMSGKYNIIFFRIPINMFTFLFSNLTRCILALDAH